MRSHTPAVPMHEARVYRSVCAVTAQQMLPNVHRIAHPQGTVHEVPVVHRRWAHLLQSTLSVFWKRA